MVDEQHNKACFRLAAVVSVAAFAACGPAPTTRDPRPPRTEAVPIAQAASVNGAAPVQAPTPAALPPPPQPDISPLQKRVDEAAAGAVIDVPPGTHIGPLRIEGKRIVLRAKPGTATLATRSSDQDLLAIVDSEVTLLGLTLAHEHDDCASHAHDGTMLTNDETSTVRLENIDVRCRGAYGVIAIGGPTFVSRSHISGCVSALELHGKRNHVLRSLFRNNVSGIMVSGQASGIVTIEDNTFADNQVALTFDAEIYDPRPHHRLGSGRTLSRQTAMRSSSKTTAKSRSANE